MSKHWRYMVVMLLLARILAAAEVTVQVRDDHRAAVADAIVTIEPQSADAVPARSSAPQTHVIDQRNETFIPYVEMFRPGDSVVFHNADNTRHHVYTFAPARQFEFVLTPGQSSEPLRLNQAGVVAVGCNIHDRMITYLYISTAPWLARTGADGRVALDGLPTGEFQVRVWHPQLRPGGADPVQGLLIAAPAEAKRVDFSLVLLPDPRLPPDRERANY